MMSAFSIIALLLGIGLIYIVVEVHRTYRIEKKWAEMLKRRSEFFEEDGTEININDRSMKEGRR